MIFCSECFFSVVVACQKLTNGVGVTSSIELTETGRVFRNAFGLTIFAGT